MPKESSNKEVWMHFKPVELKILGAYMKAYQNRLPYLKDTYPRDPKDGPPILDQVQELPKYYKNVGQRTEKPWTIWERFRMAVSTFDVEMKRRPGGQLKFAIAKIGPGGEIDSENVFLEPRVVAESKQVWDAIMGPGGLYWGNEALLNKWVDEYEPVMNKYGFKKLPKLEDGSYAVPPLDIQGGELSDMIELQDADVHSMVPKEEPVETMASPAPRRGRPPKVATA